MELWGVRMTVKGYFIQYKFIIPEHIKHSSYNYQKLFRALYGYTQAVDKSNGKRYKYHRKGVLSEIPCIRPRKNCVIIPPEYFQKLIDFFKTGRNPSHAWKGKGDWKAVYYMNEKVLDEKDIIYAFERLFEKNFSFQGRVEPDTLYNVFKKFNSSDFSISANEKVFLPHIIQKVKEISNLEWFKEVYKKSEKLNKFYSNYKKVKDFVGE